MTKSVRRYLCASLVIAAGCASDRSYAPPGTVLTDTQVSTDVARSAGLAAATMIADQDDYMSGVMAGVSSSLNLVVGLGGPLAPGPRPGDGTPTTATAPTCTYASTTGRWSCTPFVNAQGLTIIRSYAYIDASGNPTKRYNDTTTAKVDYDVQADGPIGDGATLTGTTHRHVLEVMSGLTGHETSRVWDGSGTSADTNTYSDSSGSRHYAGARIDSLLALTFAQPRPPHAYPLSGTTVQNVSYTVNSTGKSTETRSVSRRIVVTYDGTAVASVVAGNVQCMLHLDLRKVDGCQTR